MSNKIDLSHMMRPNMRLKRAQVRGGGGWVWSKELEIALIRKGDYHYSIAFSLDKDCADSKIRFPFFNPTGGGLRGIAQICDIIVLTQKHNALRAFVIEVKQKHRGNADIQIVNGVLFCKWMHSLLEEHYGFPPLEVSRVLCLLRRQPLKGTSHRDNMGMEPDKGSKILECLGESKIYLEDIHKRYKRKFGFGEKRQKAKQRKVAGNVADVTPQNTAD